MVNSAVEDAINAVFSFIIFEYIIVTKKWCSILVPQL